MIRRALVVASLFLSCSAFATWNPSFSSSEEQMTVGETRTITLRAVWSGLTFFDFSPWVCASSNESVAHVEGELLRQSATAEVTITAIGPGTTWIRILGPTGRTWGGRFVTIEVSPKPVRVTIASNAQTSTVGRPLTLVAIGEPAPLTFTWYRGRLGDTTKPLPASGEELTFTPTTPGRYYFWVSAAAPHGVSNDEIAIDVLAPPKRRAARR